MKFPTILAAGATCLALAMPAAAQDALNADTVLATVNGTEITLGHVIALTSRLPERFQSLPDADLYEGVLDQLIQQAALSAGVDADAKSVQLAIENETRALLATERLKDIQTNAQTEEAIEAAYKAQVDGQEPEQEWFASHILVETEEEAKAVIAELDGGADFAEVAKEKSTGPSGPNGGELGWASKGSFVPEFEAAMVALEDGAVSEPVQTQFGWHVIRLNESRTKPVPPLVEMRAQLMQQLAEQAIQAEVARSREAAEIVMEEVELDPATIRNTELLD